MGMDRGTGSGEEATLAAAAAAGAAGSKMEGSEGVNG